MLCSRLRRSTYTQPGRGRERTVFASRVSTCKQNGLAHERLRYPKPSFCGCFGLPKLRNIVRRSVSYHRRRRSTATIKLTSCHVAGGRRQVSASFAVCTQHKVCPVIGKGNKKAGVLVVCIDGWTCHEPMQGLLRRVVFPTRTWLLKSWRFRAWTTKRNVKFEKWKRTVLAQVAARNCSTTHHAPPICRVPSWLVFDSAILFLNSFSENFCPIPPHSLETDLYVRY